MDRGEIGVTDPRRLALFIIEGSNAVIIERVMSETPASADDDVDFLADHDPRRDTKRETTYFFSLAALAAADGLGADAPDAAGGARPRALEVNNTVERSRAEVGVQDENRSLLLSTVLPRVSATGSAIRNSERSRRSAAARDSAHRPAAERLELPRRPLAADLRGQPRAPRVRAGEARRRQRAAGRPRHRGRRAAPRRLELPRRRRRRRAHRHREEEHRARRRSAARRPRRSTRRAR